MGETTKESQVNVFSSAHVSSVHTPFFNNHNMTRMDDEDPIVVVGIGLTLPGGVENTDQLWTALLDPSDVPEAPITRQPSGSNARPNFVPELSSYRWGPRPHASQWNYLNTVDSSRWDPAFFGFGPKDASHVKPLTRLLLESCWHALEDATINPEEVAGRDFGMFVAASGQDGFDKVSLATEGCEATLKGANNRTSTATICGRLSYFYKVHGPSLVVETACSGGLVALDQAIKAIRSGDASSGALVSGAATHLWPDGMDFMGAAGALSDRCAAFSSNGSGYVPAEGALTLVLMTSSQARAQALPIYGEIIASTTTHSGRTNGIMRPCPQSQAHLIRKTLTRAGLSPDCVDFVEAHGTGTKVGDAVELQALKEVFDQITRQKPLYVTSSKTVFGHGHEYAGLLGIAKSLLILQHKVIPPHHNGCGGSVDASSAVQVPAFATHLSSRARPYVAAVSSFGYSGTLAHVLLKEHQREVKNENIVDRPVVLHIAAKSHHSYCILLERYTRQLHSLVMSGRYDECYALCDTSLKLAQHFAHQDTFTASSVADLLPLLQLASEKLKASVSHATIPSTHPETILLLPGQGSPTSCWAEGRALQKSFPSVLEEIRKVNEILDRVTRSSLPALTFLDAKYPDSHPGCGTFVTFIYQYVAAKLLQDLGINFTKVIGYSLGEVTAAVLCGRVDLEGACSLLWARQQALACTGAQEGGAMTSVRCNANELEDIIFETGLAQQCEVAAVMDTSSSVLSGSSSAVEFMEAKLDELGVVARRLTGVATGYHSPHVYNAAELIAAQAAEVHSIPSGASVTTPDLISTVTGKTVPQSMELGRYFWSQHLRKPIQFQKAVKHAARTNAIWIDLSPDNSLSSLVARIIDAPRGQNGPICAVGSRSTTDDCHGAWKRWVEALQFLQRMGHRPRWSHFVAQGRESACHRPLGRVLYPFQRQVHWPQHTSQAIQELRSFAGQQRTRAPHPLLGSHRVDTSALHIFEKRLDSTSLQQLNQHKVNGRTTLSVAAISEAILSASTFVWPQAAHLVIQNLLPTRPVQLREQLPWLRISIEASTGVVKMWARLADGEPRDLDLCCHAKVAPHLVAYRLDSAPSSDHISMREIPAEQYQQVDSGLTLSGSFLRVASPIRCIGDRIVSCEVSTAGFDRASEAYTVAPGILDTLVNLIKVANPEQYRRGNSGLVKEFDGFDMKCNLTAKLSERPTVVAVVQQLSSTPLKLSTRSHKAWLVDYDTGETLLHVSRITLFDVMLQSPAAAAGSTVKDPEPANELLHEAVLCKTEMSTATLPSRADTESMSMCFIGSSFLRFPSRRDDLTVASDRTSDGDLTTRIVDAVQSHSSAVCTLVWLCSHKFHEETASAETVEEHLATAQMVLKAACQLRRHGRVAVLAYWYPEDPATREQNLVRAAVQAFFKTALREMHKFVAGSWLSFPASSRHAAIRSLLERFAQAHTSSSGMLLGEAQIGSECDSTFATPRLVPIRAIDVNKPLHLDGTYLVTGGLGNLNRHLLPWLLKHGVRHLLITTRGDGNNLQCELTELLPPGSFTVLQWQVFNCDSLSRDISSCANKDIKGIIHTATAIQDGSVLTQGPTQRLESLRSKGAMLQALHKCSLQQHWPLENFVCFSSVSMPLCNPGQSAYNAANGFCEHLVSQRREDGLPGLSIQLGIWSEGQAQPVAPEMQRVSPALSAMTFLPLFAQVLSDHEMLPPVVTLANWNTKALSSESWSNSPFWDAMKPETRSLPSRRDDAPLPKGHPHVLDQIKAHPTPPDTPRTSAESVTDPEEAAGSDSIREEVERTQSGPVETPNGPSALQLLQDVLEIPDDSELDANTALVDLGLDSLSASVLVSRLPQGGVITEPTKVMAATLNQLQASLKGA